MAGGLIAAGIFGTIGKVIKGFFGAKTEQSKVLTSALDGLEGITEADKSAISASAKSIEALYKHGGLLERGWRPAFMWVILALIVARWFGYVPPNLTPTEIEHLYTFMYIGLSGYLPLRSLDKWMMGFQIGGLLKTFIAKKL